MSKTESCQAFDQLQADYLTSWCRLNPEAALEAGIEAHAGDLSPCDDASMGIQIALNEKSLAALDELNYEQLDDERQLNYQILKGWCTVEHHELMEHDWRYRDPARFLPLNAIHQLTLRPLENFNQALLQRLQAIPQRLRDAKSYLQTSPALIPPVWLNMARQACHAGVDFFHELPRHPRVRRAIERQDDIESAIYEAGQAISAFEHVLDRFTAQAQGNSACGRQAYERLLRHQHFLPVSASALLHFGEQLFNKTQAMITAELETSDLTLQDIRAHYPAQDQLLSVYQSEMIAARDFVLDKNLLDIPQKQHLHVVDTPKFLQHQIPFAAYLDPSINDLTQTAYYYVTPATDEADLQEHNYAAIAQTCIHEAWPGHHAQFVIANQSASGSALTRRLFPCASLYEGWALYCEQMMLEQGYQRYPGQRLVMLRDRLWRALRIIIDVKMHCGEWTIERATQEMSDKLGFSQHMAESECNWYSQAPTTPMSYAVGWALINALRDIIQPQTETDLRDFHNKLLAEGSIALPLVIQQQFGTEVWQQCCRDVFGE